MKPNRLAQEKSPYLLQHAHNPVDWYPWGDEAFETARREDKPVFLSIGYATCHWCHVMERESFENDEVARLLNEIFVCIKVDREERPDIDEIYMTVCQMLTQSGGWPLTIVMTPDQTPFFAATYIPAETLFGRTGLTELIPQIAEAWKTRRQELTDSAEQITSYLSQTTSPGDLPDDSLLEKAFTEAAAEFDQLHGGFGGAPKFPSAHQLIFLMRQNPEKARPIVDKTLKAMRLGGIWDHIGFGIHRYSTDREWLVPHFEKMLYDQAQTALACLEEFEAYGDPFHQQIAEEIFDYVLRDMTDPAGGFYSAEDADSEGVEGKFYVWFVDELKEVLSAEECEQAVQLFNVQPDGNFLDEATRQKTGANILHLTERKTVPETIRKKLFDRREQRVRPLKDTKVLTDWNGLMIAALAKAARLFDRPEYLNAAERVADFLLTEMQENGRLMHRWREGHAAVSGQLTDYAFLIRGLLELYETALDSRWLDTAIDLNRTVLEHFSDEENGGFFQTADDSEKLLIRPKSLYDGAVPSGSSVQVMNLMKLARLTEQTELESAAEQTLLAFAADLNRAPSAFSEALQGLLFAKSPSLDIAVEGDLNTAKTQELLCAVRSVYLPNKTIQFKETTNEPCVRICRNFSCDQPLSDPEAVRNALLEK